MNAIKPHILAFVLASIPCLVSAVDVAGITPDASHVYKTIGGTELNLHVFNPDGHSPADRRPAIVFFFGGGWNSGSPTQFFPHCQYLASRGMVAMSAEYRVQSRDGTTPAECVKDGKSAIRWIRQHALELGIDPDRIAAGGGSAGGHVAAACAFSRGFEEPDEDLSIRCSPDAMVLYNPVFDNGPGGYGHERVREYWKEFSPLHNIHRDAPPTLVFLGTADRLIPVQTAEEYKRRMEANGRRCDLHLYPDQPHGFFNYRNGENAYYFQTVEAMDRFLVSLGYLTQNAALPIELVEDGAWCWFQDERVLTDQGRVFFSTVSSPAGDIEVHQWDVETGKVESCLLADDFLSDDHAVPALLMRPDGHLLVAWSGHGEEAIHWTLSSAPRDIRAWGPVQTLHPNPGNRTTYNNLMRLSAEKGRIYNFHRGVGYNPNYLVSEDDGQTFRYAGRLFAWLIQDPEKGGTGIDGGRPYVIYTSNGIDAIHVLATEDHPRAFDNSLYHGFIKSGIVHRSDGTEVAPLSTTGESTIAPTDLTRVFAGNADNVAWNIDLELDPTGKPVALFSVQKDSAEYRGIRGHPEDGRDHRYHYARWDGAAWQVHEIAYAGSRLYANEDDYTGLGAIDPDDPGFVVISTNADPVTGEPLISRADGKRHHEIFTGTSPDGGQTWNWKPLTCNSSSDNIRPIIPKGSSGGRIILWLQGEYRSFTDYSLRVMATRRPPQNRLPRASKAPNVAHFRHGPEH